MSLIAAAFTSTAMAGGAGQFLDPSFSGNGVVNLPRNHATDVVALPNGKLLVAGRAHCGSGGADLIVRRLHGDGSVDRTFGHRGRACLDEVGHEREQLRGAAVNSNGRIFLTGKWISGGRQKSLVVKLDPNGDPVRRFGRDGAVILDMGADEYAEAIGFTERGKILVTGTDFGREGNYVARLQRGGQLDRSFGSRGRRFMRAGNSIEVLKNGRILLAGWTRMHVARLLPNGDRDVTFSGDGEATSEPPDGLAFSIGLAVQPNGRILVTGALYRSHDQDAYITVRYQRDGDVDQSFGDGGQVITTMPGRVGPGGVCYRRPRAGQSVTVQEDHRILVAGSVREYDGSGCTPVIGVVRYLPDGSVDSSFGNDGRVLLHRAEAEGVEPAVPLVLHGGAGKPVVGGKDGTVARLKR